MKCKFVPSLCKSVFSQFVYTKPIKFYTVTISFLVKHLLTFRDVQKRTVIVKNESVVPILKGIVRFVSILKIEDYTNGSSSNEDCYSYLYFSILCDDYFFIVRKTCL